VHFALSLEGHEDDKFYENDSKDPKEIKFCAVRRKISIYRTEGDGC
jgi:hypothetical protein